MLYRSVFLILLFIFFVGSYPASAGMKDQGGSHMKSKTDEKPVLVESCVYRAPIILSPSLEPRRKEFEQYVFNAQRRIRNFAASYGWEHLMVECYFDRVEIYDNKPDFDRRMKELCNVDQKTELPATYTAGLEQRVLISITPEIYEHVYPVGIEKDFYEKLLAHEIAHRLHVRILKGDEEAMGPIWFFEGFAIFAVGQFENNPLTLNQDEIRAILHSTTRGSYLKYGVVFRSLLKTFPLQTLVGKAGDKDFVQWIESGLGRN